MSRVRHGAFLATAIALVTLASPLTALAATSIDVGLVGTFTNAGGASGPAGGAVSITGFVDGGGAAAVGPASLSLCIPGVDPKNCLANITVDVTIPLAAIRATCTSVEIDLAAFDVVSPPSLDGYRISLAATTVVISPDTDRATRAACALGRQLDRGGRDRSVVRLLNRLLAALA